MENGALIGALAIFTIGAVLVIAIFFLGRFMSDQTNREHMANVAKGGKSATTKVGEEVGARSDTSLRERLDEGAMGDDELKSKRINQKRASNPEPGNPKHASATESVR